MAIQKKSDELVYDAKSNFGLKGWWIIILTALTMLTFTSVATLSMNVVVQGKADELGVAYGTLIAFNTPAGIVGLFATLGLSNLATRFGLKKVHVLSLFAGALSCIFWGMSNSVISYAIPVFFMFAFMSSTECVTGKMVANWFPKKKGIAAGWATMGLNAASLFMVTLLTTIYMKTGAIRNCMFFLAGLLTFMAVLTIVAYKEYPEQWGAYPDNNPNEKQEFKGKIETGWTTKKVFANKQTWLISVGVGMIAMTTFGYVSSVIPAMTMKGLSLQTALLMMTVTSVLGFIGSYFFGYIDQKLGTQKAAIILCIWLVVGIACFFIPGSLGAWGYVLLMGISIGATNNYPISMTAQVFGRSGYGVAYGVVYLIKGVFQYLCYAIQGWSLDRFGSYNQAWLIMLILCVISAVLFYIADLTPQEDPIDTSKQ